MITKSFVRLTLLLWLSTVVVANAQVRFLGRWTATLPMRSATDIAILDSVAYIAHSGAGVRILDARLLPQERQFTQLFLPAPVNAVYVNSTRLYVAHDSGLTIFDITNRTSPVRLGSYPLIAADRISVCNNYAFLANHYYLPTRMPFSWAGLSQSLALDESNPTRPQLLTSGNGASIFKLAVVGRNFLNNGAGVNDVGTFYEPYGFLDISAWDSTHNRMQLVFSTVGQTMSGYYTTNDRCYFWERPYGLPTWKCYDFTRDTLLSLSDSIFDQWDYDFETIGGFLIASNGDRLVSYNNSNPLSPVITRTTPVTLTTDLPLRKTGNRLFVPANGIREITVSDSGQIRVSQPICSTAFRQYGFSHFGSTGFQALGTGGAAMLTLPTTGLPQVVRYLAGSSNEIVLQVIQRDEYVYVLGNSLRTYHATTGGLVLTDSIHPPWRLSGIATLDSFLLVASSDSGIFQFSLTTPAHPVFLRQLTTSPALGITADSIYFAAPVRTTSTFLLFGRYNRTTRNFSQTLTPISSDRIAVQRNICAYARWDSIFYYDMERQLNLGRYRQSYTVAALALQGRNLFTISEYFNCLNIFYLPDSGAPIRVGNYVNEQNLGQPIGITAYGTRVYIPYNDRIDVFDVSNPLTVQEQSYKADLPDEITLKTHPNPFNNATTLSYTLSRNATVRVTVFDVTGRVIVELSNGSEAPGVHSVQWKPQQVASGCYFLQVRTPTIRKLAKVLYLK